MIAPTSESALAAIATTPGIWWAATAACSDMPTSLLRSLPTASVGAAGIRPAEASAAVRNRASRRVMIMHFDLPASLVKLPRSNGGLKPPANLQDQGAAASFMTPASTA